MSKNRKSRIKGNKLSNRDLQQAVLKMMRRFAKKRFNPKQISKRLKTSNNKDSVQAALDKLVSQGKVISLGDYKYQYRKQAENQVRERRSAGGRELLEGTVDMTRTGSAYIMVAGREDDVHVMPRYLNGAVHGDTVQIRYWFPRGRRKPEGEVVKVLQRAQENFVGTYEKHGQHGVVTTQGRNPIEVLIKADNTMDAESRQLVVVQVTNWGDGFNKPVIGKITNVLGEPGSSDLDMQAILINNGFTLNFPEAVIAESESLPSEIPLTEINLRRDFREVTTFTIDPLTAKDFDDALSIQYLEDGTLEIGVHIADVSHYVKPNTALDKEAAKRTTSVYLVDRVLPMLPEKISNELCSLRPKEDKLVFSAVFKMDKNGKVLDRWFGKGVIHSDRRFTYEEAQERIESGKGDFAKDIKELNRLALKLRKQRFKHGSIDFDSEEVRFVLDDNGVPIEVYVKERKEAHMLVEDFMLLANREVAAFVAKKEKENPIPFVYRIHDEPDPDKAQELARFAHELGFEMHIKTPEDIGKAYNRLTQAAETDPGLKLLLPLAIRTMAKAEYSTENIGHYGLGFQYYTHFTSPIRRYSDVWVHRILERNLEQGMSFRIKESILAESCGHISKMERRAADAERESIKYKQVEYINNHLGEQFEGVVSGIIDRGFFVQLKDNYCEGFVGFETTSEPVTINEGNLSFTGNHSKRTIKMGDTVQVVVVEADLGRRRIEMEWVEPERA